LVAEYGLLILPSCRSSIADEGETTMAKKYGAKAGKEVEKAMHEMKEGKLKSGGKTKKKVTNPKQAIAIGLSKARKAGGKVPKKASGAKTKKKS
jgi:hypothetical protein